MASDLKDLIDIVYGKPGEPKRLTIKVKANESFVTIVGKLPSQDFIATIDLTVLRELLKDE